MTASQRISVRVKPRASRDQIIGYNPALERLEVQVRAAPVNNAANESVIKLLAKSLRVPKSRLRIVSGAKSRDKIIEVNADARIDISRVFSV